MSNAAMDPMTYQPDAELSEQSAQIIDLTAALRDRGRQAADARPRLVIGDGSELELPDELVDIMVFVAENLAAHRGVTVVPVDQQLTTQDAADFLGISRPTLIKRLEAGDLAYTTVGRHRRITLADLITYREHKAAARSAALQEMADIARESGLYESTAGLSREGIR